LGVIVGASARPSDVADADDCAMAGAAATSKSSDDREPRIMLSLLYKTK
jgi:hypothetical protein